jgi:hypothetical protein
METGGLFSKKLADTQPFLKEIVKGASLPSPV